MPMPLDDTATQSQIDALDVADYVVVALQAQGYTAKVWDRAGLRVYVVHGSGRKARDMGYIELEVTDSSVALNMKPCRNGAGLGDMIIAALATSGISASR